MASLISVLSARCAQPVISATRIFLSATWNVCGSSLRDTGGITFGAILIIARSRGSGMNRMKGRPILAPSSASRNLYG